VITRDALYIDGEWVQSDGTATLNVVDSTTEELLAVIPAGTASDVDRAVRAAALAFPKWSATSPDVRGAYLQKITDGLIARSSELVEIIIHEVGTPRSLTERIQVGHAITEFSDTVQRLATYDWTQEIGNSLVVKEPVGVIGAITPWNVPLYQITLKVAPALAAGCTVVLKPSEVAPLNAFILAEIIDEADLPPGVFNLVTGLGDEVGEALTTHPLVDKISFTGSTRAGKRVMVACAETVKRVSLEMGGKSANIILDDSDFQSAVPAGVFQCYVNSGQICSAPTRMLVPRARLEEVERLAFEAASNYRVCDPTSSNAGIGPLVSAVQRDKVRDYINVGIEEGARLVAGGPDAPEGFDKGFYVAPTVFSDVSNDMTIAREEIFGPVLSIIPFDSEEEAIAIANDTVYGLSGSVWAGTKEHAIEVAQKLRAGQVNVNGGKFNPYAPFGGYKQSGIGRERGALGFEEFLEIKSIQR
jgi:acyl-CoA reductase-like NAD-dependent aldehyde dehydrogenase